LTKPRFKGKSSLNHHHCFTELPLRKDYFKMSNFTKSIVYSGVVLAVGLIAIFAIRSNMTEQGTLSYIEPASGEAVVEGDAAVDAAVAAEGEAAAAEDAAADAAVTATEAAEDAAAASTEATEAAADAAAAASEASEAADTAATAGAEAEAAADAAVEGEAAAAEGEAEATEEAPAH
jgi:cytoskeletal protein RodZ